MQEETRLPPSRGVSYIPYHTTAASYEQDDFIWVEHKNLFIIPVSTYQMQLSGVSPFNLTQAIRGFSRFREGSPVFKI